MGRNRNPMGHIFNPYPITPWPWSSFVGYPEYSFVFQPLMTTNPNTCYDSNGHIGTCLIINECYSHFYLPYDLPGWAFGSNNSCRGLNEGKGYDGVCCHEEQPDPVKDAPIPSDILPKIAGGWPSKSGEWTWVVMLLNRGRQFCGGTIIDQYHILTAAHCVVK